MKMKKVTILLTIFLTILIFGFLNIAIANDLIVVASKATQKASLNWFEFLEIKEVPIKIITPDAFLKYRNELYIVVMGSVNEPGGIGEIAKQALTVEEFQSISKDGTGKMFFKPQAWNVGQKVILFVGPNQAAVDEARKASRDKWFDMLQEWFEIVDIEGMHTY
ncbi:MAG: hypothetical protein JW932_07800 [Deltaproteobacteria bacterium]|nr:hypothetical protein [Deltaproteobacteria bacterium]